MQRYVTGGVSRLVLPSLVNWGSSCDATSYKSGYSENQISRLSSPFLKHGLTDQEVTYRYNPTADIFIQDDFCPKQKEHTAIPEGLSLWKRQGFIF